MTVSVYIPSPFRRLTANCEYVDAEGENISQVLNALAGAFPGFGDLVYDQNREVPRHINIYLNSQEIHGLQGADTPVADGDQVAIIPALAGGQA
tara:strand:+ start:3779 stop:4060 length:282 start_codon:yes stop_codon:yes gene_type:complete